MINIHHAQSRTSEVGRVICQTNQPLSYTNSNFCQWVWLVAKQLAVWWMVNVGDLLTQWRGCEIATWYRPRLLHMQHRSTVEQEPQNPKKFGRSRSNEFSTLAPSQIRELHSSKIIYHHKIVVCLTDLQLDTSTTDLEQVYRSLMAIREITFFYRKYELKYYLQLFYLKFLFQTNQ